MTEYNYIVLNMNLDFFPRNPLNGFQYGKS